MSKRNQLRASKMFGEALDKVPWATKLDEYEIEVVRNGVLLFVGRVFDKLKPGKTYRRAITDLLTLIKLDPEIRREYTALFRKAEQKQRRMRSPKCRTFKKSLYTVI